MTLTLTDLLLSTAVPVVIIVGLQVWALLELRRIRKAIE